MPSALSNKLFFFLVFKNVLILCPIVITSADLPPLSTSNALESRPPRSHKDPVSAISRNPCCLQFFYYKKSFLYPSECHEPDIIPKERKKISSITWVYLSSYLTLLNIVWHYQKGRSLSL